MKRRLFIAGLGSTAAWPVVARAQQADRVPRVGVLLAGDENDPVAKAAVSAFAQALAGCRLTNSCASARIRLMSPPAQRRSIRTLRPLVQPKSASACVNAGRRALCSGSFSLLGIEVPPQLLAIADEVIE